MFGDLSGGVIAGFVAVTYGTSYAALLFSGPLEPYLTYGISITLITAALGALVVSSYSSLYFAIGGPDSNTTAVLSIMLSSMVTEIAQSGHSAEILPTVILSLFICTLITGVALYAFGALRIGQCVRFIPYPVMGGFLAASGWLMASGALNIIAGTPLTPAGLAVLAERGPDMRLIIGVALAIFFMVGLKRSNHPLTLPVLFLGSSLAIYACLWILGVEGDAARAGGWLFEGLGQIKQYPPWQLLEVKALNWTVVLSYSGEMVATVIVCAITILLCATGLEMAVDAEMDLNRELRVHGIANLANALCGGYVATLSVARSVVTLRAGAATRAGGLIVAAMCFLILFISPDIIQLIPKIVLGSFLLYLGIIFLYEWLIEAWTRFRVWECFLIIFILVVTVRLGFTEGVAAGVLGACLDFAFNYSRIDVIKHHITGGEIRSHFERSPEEQAVLDRQDQAISIVMFQGFIFFGMASPLLDRLRPCLRPERGLRYLVLDFSDVHGVDSSAAMIFSKIRQMAQRAKIDVVFVGLGPHLIQVFESTGTLAGTAPSLVFPTLDAGLEWAEDRLVETGGRKVNYQVSVLDRWLLLELGDGIAVECLKTYLKRIFVDNGEYLFRQGSRSNTLYLIDSGRIAILANDIGGAPRRIVSLLGGTAFGTEDVYTDSTRTTSAFAELPSVVYALTTERLERLSSEYPHLAAQFHTIIMRLLAKRLRMANEEIALLRREAMMRRQTAS